MDIARTALLVCLFQVGTAVGQVAAMPEQQALARAAELLKSECAAPVECTFSSVRVKNSWFITALFCPKDAEFGVRPRRLK